MPDPRQFNVVLTYSTYADDPQDALEMAISVIGDRSSAYVEVYSEQSPDESEVEGDIEEFFQ